MDRFLAAAKIFMLQTARSARGDTLHRLLIDAYFATRNLM
ncbi:hypothetical protein HMPREF0281_00987 [Corynebacterium ammoniagenes DSM 20306]|uniref:Uncharacterized protein n=1 Tax=Corynebacterium ammoniagenes DSM 20306 TaxID=649754 RepID=A0ABP2IDL9_CORAM|nr:hypothetical protein HMPREF0281_00987 [Corynebacterium ammoniagenes DSM 20306]